MSPLDRAVDDLAGPDAVESLDGASAARVLVELRRVRARLAAVEARLVDRVDTERPWAPEGYLTTASWLAASDHSSLSAARGDVRLARRLRTMPATLESLAAGDITVEHARRLATLNAPDVADAFAEAETFLVGQARSMRWPDFTKACAYWLRHARRDSDPDPDKADHEHRHLDLHDGLRGTGLISGELTPVVKATFGTELDRLEQQLFDTDWAAAKAIHGDATTVAHLARTHRQRRHDALAEMARRSATTPADGRRPAPLVQILVGEDAFRNVLELVDGTLISAATVADLLHEAVIERIVFDGPSRVLDLGRQRTFTGAARRAVKALHRTCTGPGCNTPAEKCEIDHWLPYSDGGLTVPANGEPKCKPHHRQRQHPPPAAAPPDPGGDPPRSIDPDLTLDQRIAHLELVRTRTADRLRHDPTWGALPPWTDPPPGRDP